MKRIGYLLHFIVCIFLHQNDVQAQAVSEDSIQINQRLQFMVQQLGQKIFVRRFESVELPCVCINDNDDRIGELKRRISNSNFRIRLKQKRLIDEGTECLSNHHARYVKLETDCVNWRKQKISGVAHFTYGYPASSLIQYLGMTQGTSNSLDAYFSKMLQSTGWFEIRPEEDKYRIAICLNTGPYNKNDTAFGYIETSQSAFRKDSNKVNVSIYLNRLQIESGDKNNQIFVRMASTDFADEAIYYKTLLYHHMKGEENPDPLSRRAHYQWLDRFYGNPACMACRFIYNQVMQVLLHPPALQLPNTETNPPH